MQDKNKDFINYCLIAHPRSGSTYIRHIISFFLKTHAMQPNHNNDPTFSNWPKDLSNSKKIHFRKYHTINELEITTSILNKHSPQKKFIIIIRNPISNIKTNCKYSNIKPQHLNKTTYFDNYWKNVMYIDKIKENVLMISYYNIVYGDDTLHNKEIIKICNFFSIDIKNFNYNRNYINNLSRKKYLTIDKKINDWFDKKLIYDKCLNKINKLKNNKLKELLLYELNKNY